MSMDSALDEMRREAESYRSVNEGIVGKSEKEVRGNRWSSSRESKVVVGPFPLKRQSVISDRTEVARIFRKDFREEKKKIGYIVYLDFREHKEGGVAG